MMKKHWKSLLLLFLFAAFALGFQSREIFWGIGKPANRYPPDFPSLAKRTRPFTKQDTTEGGRLIRLAWKSLNFGQNDSLAIHSQKLIQIGEKLLAEGFDSLSYDFWSVGYASLAHALIYLGDMEQGSQISVEFEAIDHRVYPKDYLARGIRYIGAGHMANNLFDDVDLALDYYHQAENSMRNCLAQDDPHIAWPYLWLGYFYCQKGDQDKGLAYLKRVLALKTTQPDIRWFAHLLTAEIYEHMEDYQTAIQHLLAARKYPGFLGSKVDVEHKLSQVYLQIGDHKTSWKYIQEMDAIIKRSGQKDALFYRDVMSHFCDANAEFALKMKDYPTAIDWQRKRIGCLFESERAKSNLHAFEEFQSLAQTFLLADSLPAAKTTLEELLARETKTFQTADFAQNPPAAAFTRQPFHLKTLELKGRYFEKLFEKTADPAQLENALRAYALADSLIEKIRETYRGVGSKNQLSGAAKPIYQRTIDCAFQLWQRTGEAKYLDHAWAAAEKSKSVNLLESLRESEAKQLAGFRPADQQHEKLLKRNLDYFEKLVFDEQARPRPDSLRLARWNRQIFNLKNSQDSLVAVFQDRYPEYHRLKYDRRLASIADVQAKLAPDNALVEYFLGDSVLFTFWVDKAGARAFRQKIDSSFHQNIAALRATVHDFDPGLLRSEKQQFADFQKFTAASHGLCQTLLGNCASILQNRGTTKLVIVPDDQLGYIPFAALLREPVAAAALPDYRRLPYLVRDFSLRLEYSGTLLAGPARAGSYGMAKSGFGYLGMAPVYPGGAIAARSLPDSFRFARAFSLLRGGEVPALRFNGAEIDSTQHLFGGKTSSGEAATEAFFKKNAPNARVLHLAMHALTNDGDPLYSTLLFSKPNPADTTGENDGFLHAFELYKMRLSADLAVLSACNTGAGKVVSGEGIMSLARAFRFAGCPNVMMSLWSVNDAAAADLVVGFFKKLSGGTGKAAALQAAQIDFLRNTKSDALAHPYFWATFSLVGDDETVAGTGGGGLLLWGLLLLVFGLLWLVLRSSRNG